jgi:glycosyltransferase involved in cell wall biosynthesis
MMLCKLLSMLNRERYSSEVISLTDIGEAGGKIRALGVPITALGACRGMPDPRILFRLVRILRRNSPAIVQTWMYHADLIGGLAAKLAGGIPAIWGIRASNLDSRINGRSVVMTAKLCARLSSFIPQFIVCCSEAGKRVHRLMGYRSEKLRVIPNGFDVDCFIPDAESRAALRAECGVGNEALLVGHVARFDRMKDHRGFIEAAARVHASIPTARFIFCGDGLDWRNSVLVGWMRAAKIESVCILLGRRFDLHRIYAALDAFVVSSANAEGFPNVLGEAMSCAVPCVSTDVGDARRIISDTGYVVPPGEPEQLSTALTSLLRIDARSRAILGHAARRRIVEHFSLPAIVRQYEELYEEVRSGRPVRPLSAVH